MATVTIKSYLAPSKSDKIILFGLMRNFSCAVRFAYQMLVDGENPNDARKKLCAMYDLNSRYASDAVFRAEQVLRLLRTNGNGNDVNFSSALYSRGDRRAKGNLNLRFLCCEDGNLVLRVNISKRKWLYIPVVCVAKMDGSNRWDGFNWQLQRAKAIGEWFPYSVGLKMIHDMILCYVNVDEEYAPKDISLVRQQTFVEYFVCKTHRHEDYEIHEIEEQSEPLVV